MEHEYVHEGEGGREGGYLIPVPILIFIKIPLPSLTLAQMPAAKYEIPYSVHLLFAIAN